MVVEDVNYEVDDEGNGVGVSYWISYNSCATLCNENMDCNSFVHCTMNSEGEGDCSLKDKTLDGSENSSDTSTGNQCTTYYKKGNGTLRTDNFKIRVYKC